MVSASHNDQILVYQLTRQAYRRASRLGWLMFAGFVFCIAGGIIGGLLLWSTYTHELTPYLKWQDMLVACCWCLALVSLGGSLLVLRFWYALRQGYRVAMLTLEGTHILRGRDLSPKNFTSIFWAVATTFACFVVMLIGLSPAVLLGWTLHLANPVLLVFATGAVLLLSLAGLLVSLTFGAFFLIGLAGGVSLGRTLGAAQTYLLNSRTTVRIHGFVLALLQPDTPEALFDLQLLSAQDQHQLLTLLRARWQEESERTWNPALGEQIEAAFRRARVVS